MTCPNCHALSCYICRELVTGYGHFDQQQNVSGGSSVKCALWDPVEKRHHEEVRTCSLTLPMYHANDELFFSRLQPLQRTQSENTEYSTQTLKQKTFTSTCRRHHQCNRRICGTRHHHRYQDWLCPNLRYSITSYSCITMREVCRHRISLSLWRQFGLLKFVLLGLQLDVVGFELLQLLYQPRTLLKLLLEHPLPIVRFEPLELQFQSCLQWLPLLPREGGVGNDVLIPMNVPPLDFSQCRKPFICIYYHVVFIAKVCLHPESKK